MDKEKLQNALNNCQRIDEGMPYHFLLVRAPEYEIIANAAMRELERMG